ncbi:MAG: multidrug efflux pump [Saprospiraceae bacterium]|jgi:multidrug efflux pump
MENKKNKGLKEFGLSTLSLKNPTTIIVLTIILAMIGMNSYKSMPREAFPEVVLPQIFVGTPYPGNSPLDIEKLITRPLEKEINTITGIDKVVSNSVQGYSTIDIKFDFSVTPTQALRKVKDAVDKVKGDPSFPKDLPADPNVFEMNMSDLVPALNVNLSGDFSMDMLKEYAEILEDRIEEIPQITKVDIRGIQEKEVKVNVDLFKMESMEVTFNDIEQAIAQENMTISGGDVVVDGLRRNVRLVGEFQDWKKIGDIIIKNEKFNIVYLRDVANVVFEEKERESFAREYGAPVVMLDVMKRGGENLIEASEQVNKIIEDAKENDFPAGLEISITNDLTGKTKTQVNELENSIIFGTILVVLVLLFFLGLRNAAFVGIAIPLSMFIAFFILNTMGVTLNMMVLFSLVLALGMLVDNGIVIVENIYRLMDEGYKPFEAAKYGAGEVAWPIIASTATTLAAFVPLALWPGIMGEFMKFLPITLMIVLGSSLFVALVINPVLIALMARMSNKGVKILAIIIAVIGLSITFKLDAGAGNMLVFIGVFILINPRFISPTTTRFQESFLPKLENRYKLFLSYALTRFRPIGVLLGVIVLFGASIGLLKVLPPKVVFFPANEPAYLNVFIEKPIGTDIKVTDSDAKMIEEKVINFFKRVPGSYTKTLRDGSKEEVVFENDSLLFLVKSIITQVGNGTSDPANGPSMANTPEKARVQVSFVEYVDRKGVLTSDIMNSVREEISDNPGVSVVVDKDPAGPPMGKPINIEIAGDNYEELVNESEKMLQFIKNNNIEGVEELKMNIETSKPELIIKIDAQKARRLNLSTAQIGMTIRTALFGKQVSKFKQGEDEYDITVRLNEYTRNNIDNLMNQRITFRDMLTGKIRQVPISAVATVGKSSTISSVKRIDLKRTISLQSNVLDDYNPNEVVAALKKILNEEYKISNGLTWNFTGQQEEQAKEMEFLVVALAIALFLILLIIVAQFNSISAPVIILFAVLLSFTGVFTGLIFFRMEFVIIMMMIGIISLAGVVVNNAIVLVDYTKLLITRKELELGISGERTDKLPVHLVKQAIVDGGKTRLRPVLLTAITTILGLLPMATGLNIDFFGLFGSFDANISVGGDNVIFWGPMAWTIIFGLSFATFLTLVIVPVMFYLSLRLKYKVLGIK